VSSSPPPYQQPYHYQPPPDHPSATTVLVLGILGLVLCQLISPFAWVMGNRVVREIDGSRGAYGGRGVANAGRICGMVGTILIFITIGIVVIALMAAAAGS
jgi:hypothetical protein